MSNDNEDENVAALPGAKGSHMATVLIYRMPDGAMRGELAFMALDKIESEEKISNRFVRLATWMARAAQSFIDQAESYRDQGH